MADMVAAIKAASSRNCTQPCSTITLVADITLGSLSDTLRLSGPVYIVGACASGPCKIDGGGEPAGCRGCGWVFGRVATCVVAVDDGTCGTGATTAGD